MFWSAVGVALTLLLTSCHLYDRLHRGLPGVVRMRAINAGSAVNAAYLASMASGRKWGHFDDRRAGDPLATLASIAPRGRADRPQRAGRPVRVERPSAVRRPAPALLDLVGLHSQGAPAFALPRS